MLKENFAFLAKIAISATKVLFLMYAAIMIIITVIIITAIMIIITVIIITAIMIIITVIIITAIKIIVTVIIITVIMIMSALASLALWPPCIIGFRQVAPFQPLMQTQHQDHDDRDDFCYFVPSQNTPVPSK